MNKVFSLIKETLVPRRIEIQPIMKVVIVSPGKSGFYMLNTFGEPLKTNIVTMVGREVSIEDYAREVKMFLRDHVEEPLIDVDGVDVIKCKDLLRILNHADFIHPKRIAATGKIIV